MMIIVNEEKIELEGNPIEIISEYTCLTKHIIKCFGANGISEDETWEMLSESHKMAKMTEEELNRKMRELLVQLMLKSL